MKLRPSWRIRRRRTTPDHQRLFAFVERSRRRERVFKQVIVLMTMAAVLLILQVFPWGRYLEASLGTRATRLTRRAFGATSSRKDLNEDWRNYRRFGIESARPRVRKFYEESDPAFRKLLRYAGMDPAHGLLRWGNYNWTLLLSSKVFEADDQGRSYRLRPHVKSIWLRQLNYQAGAIAFYLVPDGPGLAEAVRGTTAIPYEPSRQWTNSWGLRGPEPDPSAPLRVMVLGDSYMQGMFIGDDETPPRRLRRYLEGATKGRVSVLNTGVMGYSPEQYHAALLAFADRFRPHLVVVSFFANDGGSEFDAVSFGRGDWNEADYWLERIHRFCRARGWPCLFVPAPFPYSMLGRRQPGNYPGRLANLLEVDSPNYFNPVEFFLNEHLRTRIEALRGGREPLGSSLFNSAIKDAHFSPLGAEVWAEAVGRRLLLLREDDRLARGRESSSPAPGPKRPSLLDDRHASAQ